MKLARSLLISACSLLLLGGCASNFHFAPPEGHPARADAAAMPAPVAHAPDDYRPPEPVEGNGMQMRGSSGETEHGHTDRNTEEREGGSRAH